MKKLIALAAAIMLALPGAALADGVLADGWQQASLDDLMAARAALDQQITALSTQAAAADAMTFTGTGKTVIDGFTLPAGAWAFLVQLPEAATGTTTICEGGKNFTDRHFTAYAAYAHAAHYPKGMSIDYITMDYPGAWQLTVVQIPEAGSAAFTATGSGVSGFFLPSKAQQVTITTTAAGAGYYTLDLLEANRYRTNPSGHLASHGTLDAGATQVDTYLLTPDKDVYGYVWMMNSPDGFQWSITVQ